MNARLVALILCLVFISCAKLFAQFDSGSTGAYGPMNITADTTLNMPNDGIFNCTTITIAQGKTLRFNKNSGNTPVYLLATSDVKIHGKIDISGGAGTIASGGQGGPGGFDGGMPGNGTEFPPGSGGGPGGGLGGKSGTGIEAVGSGSYRTKRVPNRVRDGSVYGSSLLIPLVGGSGGGGTSDGQRVGGGGGGGAILIASNTRIDLIPNLSLGNSNQSAIIANSGSSSDSCHGSGGAIRLISPVVTGGGPGISGIATLSVASTGGSGEGRTRVDCLDRSNLLMNGVQATGSLMIVFPSPFPKLSITTIAGNAIAEGTTAGVELLLPSGTPTAQSITVRARDFGRVTPLRIALIPESGDPTFYDVSIDNAAANPADLTTNIVVPVNQQVRIQVWTR